MTSAALDKVRLKEANDPDCGQHPERRDWLRASLLLQLSRSLIEEKERKERSAKQDLVIKGTHAKKRALNKLLIEGCSKCDFDESEGLLIDHCDDCCRRIATLTYSLLIGHEQ